VISVKLWQLHSKLTGNSAGVCRLFSDGVASCFLLLSLAVKAPAQLVRYEERARM